MLPMLTLNLHFNNKMFKTLSLSLLAKRLRTIFASG